MVGKEKDGGKVKATCRWCDDTGKVPDFKTKTMVTCKCRKEQDDG
jgi:hypothetical protein